MAKFLTDEEWKDYKGKFHWLRFTADIGSDDIRWEIMKKWIANNIDGWVYFDGVNTFIFESVSELTQFSLFAGDGKEPHDGTLDANFGSV